MSDVYSAPTPVAAGPIGQIRSTGTCILLMIVTLGIYSLVYYFKTHEEMKQHSGQGLGGAVALILGLFVSIVLVFTFPGEVGKLRQSRGQEPKVSAMTGFWVLLPLIGSIVWFVKTNGALNEYWESQGATA
jgi:membrane protease YdiL (CAAX protease family)